MKLAKILLSGLAIPSVALPMTTLASCGTSWGNKTPFMIGSIGNGPYAYLDNCFDKDGNIINNYLQTQYAVQTKTSTSYAYSTPFKYDSAQNKWTQNGESGWYTSGDESFVTTATDSDGKEVKGVANAALAPNIDFVSSIGSSINSFINYAMQYQGQQIKKGDETNLKIAWGGEGKTKFELDHETNNNDFFEYIFANANINGKGKSKAQLRTSIVDFKFVDMPLPNYTKESKVLSYSFAQLCENKADFVDPQYASGNPKEIEEDGTKFNVYTYDAVPVRVNLDHIIQTYLNPTIKDDSFLVNDFYSATDEIKNSIGDQWKKTMPDFTSYEEKDCIPHIKTFVLNSARDNIKIIAHPTNCDKRIEEIWGSDFIALIGYSVKVAVDEDKHAKDTATITGLQNIFPAYFIDVYGDSMFKANDKGQYIIDQDKVNKGISKWLEMIKRTGGSGYETDLTKLDQEHKDLLMFLGYVFGDDVNKVNTNKLLEVEKI